MARGGMYKNHGVKKRNKMKDSNTPRKSTPGITKQENCHASPQSRTMCRRNRSYRYPGYDAWSKAHRP